MSPTTYGEVLARNIRAARSRADLSQQDLAARMQRLGYSAWLYQTVGNVERGKRRVTAEEILALALALGTTISALMSASDQDGAIELPGGQALGAVSVERLAGRGINDLAIAWRGTLGPSVTGFRRLPGVDPFDREQFRQPTFAEKPDKWHPGPGAEQQPAVIAAIVTSGRNVLVGRRNDRTPPWTFIAGEQEPGEQPEDTAIREVKEETGCEVRTGEEIGRRVHPKTGRTLIYIAAWPVHRTRLIVGDEAELAEVRWASLAEAEELLPDMFEPVHEYLARALDPRAPARDGGPGDG
jgi:8-oxo-dGTP pyrophosphatase MutT (NUDIX family)/transcriptional regulator with XRE-family HTH domain